MRKCWNCGKGVPVGAKRCIYCHAPVKPPKKGGGDAGVSLPKGVNPSHTLLGVGQRPGDSPGGDEPKVDEAVGGSTMFGMGTRGKGGPLGSRKPSTGKGVRQTLMGLGAVRVLNEPSDEDGGAPKMQGNVRSTMSGMPGVRTPRRGGGNDSGNRTQLGGARSTMAGMPAVERKPKKGALLSRGSYNLKNDEASDSATVPVTEEHIQTAKALAKKREEESRKVSRPETRPAKKVEIPAVDEDEVEEFDPLEGFAGAAQGKISSLIDEEVEDLSSAVFGSDFAFDEEIDDDEDDEWDDFEFGGDEPAKPVATAKPPAGAGAGDIPEDEVEHDLEAAAAALGDMMADLEDVMPTEDEAAASLGLDESRIQGPEEVDEDPTIADANVAEMMSELQTDPTLLAHAKAADEEKARIDRISRDLDVPSPANPRTAVPSPAAPVAPVAARAEVDDAGPTTTLDAQSSGGTGVPGVLGLLGAIAAVVWLFIPGDSGTAVSQIGSLDTSSLMLVVTSIVAALLAAGAAVLTMSRPIKGTILAVLGIGLGLLSVVAPIMAPPLTFAVYAAAGLLFLGGVLYFITKPKG